MVVLSVVEVISSVVRSTEGTDTESSSAWRLRKKGSVILIQASLLLLLKNLCAREGIVDGSVVLASWEDSVCGDAGMRTKRPLFTRLISRSAMPNSGGLMKSSAEFTNKIGAETLSSCGKG
jgi:hypothetical protein